MKTEERVLPELIQETRETARPRRSTTAEGEKVEELAAEDVEIAPDEWVQESTSEPNTARVVIGPEGEAVSGPVEADRSGGRVTNNLKTAEIDIDRDRRSTLTSPIPAMLAEGMRNESGIPEKRDPAAPEGEATEHTRRLGDSDRQRVRNDQSAGYTVEVVHDANVERRKRAARLIDRARAFMDAGALRAAAGAAEEALEEAEQAPPPGIIEVIEPARPLLGRIFAGFVGPLSEVPVLARRTEDIDMSSFDARKRAFIARVDGVHSLDQIFDAARISTADALRIAAWLMGEGIIRVV